MAIHSSILAQRIPWTEEADGLQSIEFHQARVLEWGAIAFSTFMLIFPNSLPPGLTLALPQTSISSGVFLLMAMNLKLS